MKKANQIFDEVDTIKLRQGYMDACSNPDFQKYMNSLNIEEETLMKYTSTLEDSFEEILNCSKCNSLSKCKNQVQGYRLIPKKDKNSIVFSYITCNKKNADIDNKKYLNNIELFDMPKEISKASFKELYKDDKLRIPVIKYFKEFIDNYDSENKKGLYLNGSFGSGKTYLVAALFNEMAKKNVKSVLVYYPEFLRSLKASFSTDYKEKFNTVKKVELLLLDDIGAENCSAWSRDEVLGPILQYRMDQNLPTFFTSNLTINELEQTLSTTNNGVDKVKARRIIERVKHLTNQLELISKNRRN